MKYKATLFFFLLLLGLNVPTAYSLDEGVVKHIIDEDKTHEPLIGSQYLEDAKDNLRLEDVRTSKKWKAVKEENFNQGFNASTWWVRANIFNTSEQLQKRILEISYPILDYLDVYIIDEKNNVIKYSMGDKLPFYKRIVEHRNFIVPFDLAPNTGVEFYFRSKTQGSMQLPVTVWEPENFYIMDQSRSLFLGVYFGIMLVMIFYNLFIYFTLSERNYLYYVLFVSSITLFLASLSGYAFQYLWPHLTNWNDRAIVFFLGSAVLFGSIFTMNFLGLQNFGKIYNILLRVLIILSAIAILGVFLLSYNIMIRYVVVVAVGTLSTGLIIGFNTWMRGETIGKYYTLSWGVLFIGGLVFAFSKSNMLEQSAVTDYAVQVGSALQVLLLSFALAERINVEKHLRFEAQEKVLSNEQKLREAQNQILLTQKKTNELLEMRVKERTEDLEKLNEKLLTLSSTDKLTGLKNRGFLDEILTKELAHSIKWEQNLCLMLLDIDSFKKFNDDYGHLLGDECLKQVSNKITDCVQKTTDYAMRYGGEEFCIILPKTPLKGAMAVAERLRASIESIKINAREKTVSVTVSVGLVEFLGDENISVQELLGRANKALYMAKKNGRNQVAIWETS